MLPCGSRRRSPVGTACSPQAPHRSDTPRRLAGMGGGISGRAGNGKRPPGHGPSESESACHSSQTRCIEASRREPQLPRQVVLLRSIDLKALQLLAHGLDLELVKDEHVDGILLKEVSDLRVCGEPRLGVVDCLCVGDLGVYSWIAELRDVVVA